MKTRSILVAACIAVVLASTARGQFVTGHVFLSEPGRKNCTNPNYPSDRVWEIDPQTGAVRLFRELFFTECGGMSGLTFTPDGERLRASMYLTSQIVEFDPQGNVTVALDANDGIYFPSGSNNIAYDAGGDFYVVIATGLEGRILRFPADGGPATVFADESDGIGNGGPIAFAADGDLYYARAAGGCYVLRITPEGSVSLFDQYLPCFSYPKALTADRDGFLYVGLDGGEIFRYRAGDAAPRKLLLDSGVLPVFGITMSLDHSSIYGIGSVFPVTLVAIDRVDGTVTTLAEIAEGQIVAESPFGIAVAPGPPIPAASEWGLVVMGLLLLIVGTIMARRVRFPARS